LFFGGAIQLDSALLFLSQRVIGSLPRAAEKQKEEGFGSAVAINR
jgi:hypothetical protein